MTQKFKNRVQMLPAQRRGLILDHLQEHRAATIHRLCAVVSASPATVRRDLDQLTREGLLERTRGGAIVGPATGYHRKNIAGAASEIETAGAHVFTKASSEPRLPDPNGVFEFGSSADEFPILDRKTLNERVYGELRKALASGRFAPGMALTIRGVADMFGISTTPVREALARLVTEQALETRANRSIVVPMMTRARFLELKDIRLANEGLAAERAARALTRDNLSDLAGYIEKMSGAVESSHVKAYLAYNEKFHFTIYRAAKMPILLQIIERMWVQIGPFFNYLFFDGEYEESANTHHIDMLEALRVGDAVAARQALERDIEVAARQLTHALGRLEEAR